MNIGQKIRYGAKWMLTGRISGEGLQFLFGIVLARLLVPADFGMMVTIHIFTGFAGFLAGGGTGQALIQSKDIQELHYRVVFTMQFFIGLTIFLFLVAIAPFFAVWFKDPLYVDLLRVSALTFLIRPFTNLPNVRLNREYRFKEIALTRFMALCISGVSGVWFALQGMGPWSLILSGLIGPFATLPVLYWLTRWRPWFAFDRDIVHKLGGYGARFTSVDILVYFKAEITNLIISIQIGASSLGIYNKASSLSLMPMRIVAAPVMQAVFRGMSQVTDNRDMTKYMYLRTVSLLSAYMFPIYVFAWWLAESFIVVLYGEKWRFAATALQILAVAGIFRCVSRPAGVVMASQNILGREIRIHVESLVLIVAGVLMVVQYGVQAVAIIIVLGMLYTCVRVTMAAARHLDAGFRDLMTALLPSLVLSTALFIMLMITDYMLTLFGIPVDGLVYLVVMAASGSLFYAALFMLVPINAFKNEVSRIKSLIRPVRQV